MNKVSWSLIYLAYFLSYIVWTDNDFSWITDYLKKKQTVVGLRKLLTTFELLIRGVEENPKVQKKINKKYIGFCCFLDGLPEVWLYEYIIEETICFGHGTQKIQDDLSWSFLPEDYCTNGQR